MSGVLIELRRGGLYLSCEVYERFFAGLETVVLLRRKSDLVVLPVRHPAAGGYLLKRRNGVGDRVVFAPDFFREHGISDDADCKLEADWDAEQVALIASECFARAVFP
ncbi:MULTISPECIES: hypothetical protein [Mesorhizobium]|uniref:Uncharacterized protein n=1 Tax=Mesorhizobium calcicola TaxID=1300310 RepID=A0ABW4WEH7_9HYPH|nr:hypothetical protein [Mesorhizobium sophorae]